MGEIRFHVDGTPKAQARPRAFVKENDRPGMDVVISWKEAAETEARDAQLALDRAAQF